LEAIVCDENDVIAKSLEAAFEITEVANHHLPVLHTGLERSEQSFELFTLPGTQ
jgi:hypothetical protein